MHHHFSGTSARAGGTRVLAAATATLLATLAPLSGSNADSRFPVTAFAKIAGCTDDSIGGFATLKERASDEGVKQVDVYMLVEGLDGGDRGVHIHQTGSCEPCSSARGHFDPGPYGETDPNANHPYHLGDLINLEVDDKGRGTMRTRTSRVTLSAGPLSVFDEDGSAFIVHVNEDTYCPGNVEGGTPAPDCAGGARAACGIIRKADADDFELLVSSSSKRERPTGLDGTSLDKKAYIFLSPLDPATDVESVDFFIDGRQVAHLSAAPYDLGGSKGGGQANDFDTGELADGTHVLSAVIDLVGDDQAFVSSTFTVDNDKKRFLNGSENH